MADLKQIITAAANQYGVNPDWLIQIAQKESGLNSNAKNPNSSASGPFQFINSTAQQYGLNNPFDPEQSSDAAARLTRDNINSFKKRFGRDPTFEETYLAHQQGIRGLSKLLENPNAKASDLVGSQAISLNRGDPNATASDFLAKWGIGENNSVNESPVAIDVLRESPNQYNKGGKEDRRDSIASILARYSQPDQQPVAPQINLEQAGPRQLSSNRIQYNQDRRKSSIGQYINAMRG